MGIDIEKTQFAAQDFSDFRHRLADNLDALRHMLDDPEFGRGGGSLGAELEMYLVDENGRPAFLNQEILARSGDPQLTLELNRYNLEYNLSPYAITDTPFRRTEQEIHTKLAQVRAIAADMGARVVPIGILPTLNQADFGGHCITDRKRYHALVAQLIERRGSAFQIDINGENPLKLEMADITLEGANTSFQVHHRVNPADYADTFNAVQLVSPLGLAIAANSPTLFGHYAWLENAVSLAAVAFLDVALPAEQVAALGGVQSGGILAPVFSPGLTSSPKAKTAVSSTIFAVLSAPTAPPHATTHTTINVTNTMFFISAVPYSRVIQPLGKSVLGPPREKCG